MFVATEVQLASSEKIWPRTQRSRPSRTRLKNTVWMALDTEENRFSLTQRAGEVDGVSGAR